MEKALASILLLCGIFLIPIGIGIPMVIQGCRVLSRDDSAAS